MVARAQTAKRKKVEKVEPEPELSDARVLDLPKIYTRQEAADVLRVSLAFVDRRITTGEIRAIHLGSRKFVTEKEIRRLLAEGLVE